MKSFISEFKEFALRGNVMDMAVGIIIGAAFTAIVTSLVDDLISPIIGMFVKVDFNNLVATVNGVDLKYGAFIMAVVNFVIVALVLFSIIKAMNKATSLTKKEEEAEEEPTTKECPFCLQEIPIKATRCPHCTSELSE
ncbi:MAG: large conductance mechanosensitive channel protein MscL [Lachnospiraceae bacterium]|nr:large conductance mechanosensitive channel protein MscL [Lachnospiraceae bacterium]